MLFILGFSSARFEGSLNMDLNEIAMNLVPFPRLHYLVPSLTPLYTLADVSIPTRRSAVWLPWLLFLPHSCSDSYRALVCCSSHELHHPLNMRLMLTSVMNDWGSPSSDDLTSVKWRMYIVIWSVMKWRDTTRILLWYQYILWLSKYSQVSHSIYL